MKIYVCAIEKHITDGHAMYLILRKASQNYERKALREMVSKKILKIPKGITRIRKSKKNRQHNGQKKKEQTTIYKTLHQYQQNKQPPLTSSH